MAQYCHISYSKCPLFARTHARRRPRHSSIAFVNRLVSAMPNMQKTLLQFTTLVYIIEVIKNGLYKSKIVCYLQGIFNSNQKLKQQIRK